MDEIKFNNEADACVFIGLVYVNLFLPHLFGPRETYNDKCKNIYAINDCLVHEDIYANRNTYNIFIDNIKKYVITPILLTNVMKALIGKDENYTIFSVAESLGYKVIPENHSYYIKTLFLILIQLSYNTDLYRFASELMMMLLKGFNC